MIYLPDATWGGILAACIVGALIAGFFLSRWVFKRELAKNPPINENQIRAMYMAMGKKPSEADIRRVINAMRRSSGN